MHWNSCGDSNETLMVEKNYDSDDGGNDDIDEDEVRNVDDLVLNPINTLFAITPISNHVKLSGIFRSEFNLFKSDIILR